nr:RHS repeat-associated core domain-containing protein [Taylorella equigenitalis]
MKSSTFRGARAGSRLDTQYRYDVFGRRIGKRVVDVRTKEVLEQTLYDWDGLTIASEDRIGEQLAVQAQIRKDAGSEIRKLSSEVQYLYEDGEFVPLVQYTNTAAVGLGYGSLGGGSKGVAPAIYHYVNDQIGTPQILMNAEQEVVWEAQAKAWGDTIISAPVSDDGVINNHRFQGQYFDAESELHYNTFRYYDPEIGRFISQDPIGLLGGLNNYQYAPNPVEWVDPLGLKGTAIRPGDDVTHDIVLVLTQGEYEEAFGHIKDYIEGKIQDKTPRDIFTIDRQGASARRKESLRGIQTCEGKDRDEFPMAMFKEGGEDASVRSINRSDNRGAGSSIGRELANYPDGTRLKIVFQ